MARRKSPEKENHDRWLVSYADLVTLLFAFFVVMFASTQSDKTRAKEISEAVVKALSDGGMPRVASMLGGSVDDARKPDKKKDPVLQLPDLASSFELLKTQLKGEIARGSVDVRVEQRGVIIGLNSAIFFPSGGDAIDEHLYPTLAKVAAVLNQLPNALRLEGHTDSLPISNARFRSNWELSAARSIAMLRVLNENYGVDRGRLAIVGYADTNAIDSNETEDGRKKNRRVDIVIVSAYGMRAEPAKGSSKTPPDRTAHSAPPAP